MPHSEFTALGYPVRRPHSLRAPPMSGFTLVELAIVLVVIGLILGAVTIGKDVQRNAIYQRIANDYIQAWAIAYDRYYDGTGHPPGDSATAPTGLVNGGTTELCGGDLRAAMQAAGIAMPSGRAVGVEDHYGYLDSNGNPQDLHICFQNVSWSEPDATPGHYVTRARNVMVITGMTPALANLIDNAFDSRVDARFGNFRETSQADVTTANAVSIPWSVDERMPYGSTTATSLDESQVAVVSGYLKMTR